MLQQWNEVLTSLLPDRWMRATALVVAALIASWFARWIIVAVASRLAQRSGTEVDDAILKALRRPVFWSVLLWGLSGAVISLQLEKPVEDKVLRIDHTVVLLVWLFAGFQLCHVFVGFFSRLADRVEWIQPRTVPLVENIGRVMLVVLVGYSFLKIWELDAAPWLASASVVGLAVGFAAKDTLANLFGGFFIIIDAPYKIGDFINLDTGERGEVTRIGLRSTRILTRDDVEVTIPNAEIASSKIVNEAGGRWEKTRVRIKVGVAYGSDVDQVRTVLLEAAESIEYCVGEPEPRVRFRAFGDSSLDFELLVWILRPELRGRCKDALLTEIYKRFQGAAIEIPFPQRDVHVRTLPKGYRSP
jgi:small-conductance mechanosensitive channel